MLVVLGVWRYVIKRFPLRYDPLYWGAVFPVGMYAAATWQMARAMNLGFLQVIPQYFVYFAIFAWIITFVGLLSTMGRRLLTIGDYCGLPSGSSVARTFSISRAHWSARDAIISRSRCAASG